MPRLVTTCQAADGGYPPDNDLHNMTDDGCPLTPDPARWADDDWNDNLGESDTSGGPPGGQATPAHPGPRLIRPTAAATPPSQTHPATPPK